MYTGVFIKSKDPGHASQKLVYSWLKQTSSNSSNQLNYLHWGQDVTQTIKNIQTKHINIHLSLQNIAPSLHWLNVGSSNAFDRLDSWVEGAIGWAWKDKTRLRRHIHTLCVYEDDGVDKYSESLTYYVPPHWRPPTQREVRDHYVYNFTILSFLSLLPSLSLSFLVVFGIWQSKHTHTFVASSSSFAWFSISPTHHSPNRVKGNEDTSRRQQQQQQQLKKKKTRHKVCVCSLAERKKLNTWTISPKCGSFSQLTLLFIFIEVLSFVTFSLLTVFIFYLFFSFYCKQDDKDGEDRLCMDESIH